MKILNWRKNEPEPFLLNTAREHGKWSSEYLIGTSLDADSLPDDAYDVWDASKKANSQSQWSQTITKNNKLLNEFDEAVEFFTLKHYIHFISGSKDNQLKNLTVYRSGIALGKDEGQYWVGSYLDKERRSMRKEQYTLWMMATGVRSLYSIIERFSLIYNYSAEKAFDIAKEHIKYFVLKGFWTIDYTPDDISIAEVRRETEWDKKLNLLAVGIEYDIDDHFGVSHSGTETILTLEEYRIWQFIKQHMMNFDELNKLSDNKNTPFSLEETIQGLINKGLLVSWSRETFLNNNVLRFAPCGTSLACNLDKKLVAFKSLMFGPYKKVPLSIYFLWARLSPTRTIQDLVHLYIEEVNCSREDAIEAVYEFIPYLIAHELAVCAQGE